MLPNFVQFLLVISTALFPVVWTLPLLNLEKLLGSSGGLLKANGVLPTNPDEVLATHNHFREIHGSPPLTWDDKLAAFALEWSNECVLKHSGGPYGENIAKGPTTWKESITDWYNEQSQYDFSNPGWTEETGHFSQLIWKSTSTVGCGAVYCPNLGGNYYTCEYFPRGNILSSTADQGKYFAQNVN